MAAINESLQMPPPLPKTQSTKIDRDPGKTFASRAFEIPEILDMILDWISLDDQFRKPTYEKYSNCSDKQSKESDPPSESSYGIEGVPARCGLVNKLWNTMAMSKLWSGPGLAWKSNYNLHNLFKTIAPSRRQFYANFVKKAKIDTVRSGLEDKESMCYQTILAGIRFPILRELNMKLELGRRFCIPLMDGSTVESLELEPVSQLGHVFGMRPEHTAAVLMQIPVGFHIF